MRFIIKLLQILLLLICLGACYLSTALFFSKRNDAPLLLGQYYFHLQDDVVYQTSSKKIHLLKGGMSILCQYSVNNTKKNGVIKIQSFQKNQNTWTVLGRQGEEFIEIPFSQVWGAITLEDREYVSVFRFLFNQSWLFHLVALLTISFFLISVSLPYSLVSIRRRKEALAYLTLEKKGGKTLITPQDIPLLFGINPKKFPKVQRFMMTETTGVLSFLSREDILSHLNQMTEAHFMVPPGGEPVDFSQGAGKNPRYRHLTDEEIIEFLLQVSQVEESLEIQEEKDGTQS